MASSSDHVNNPEYSRLMGLLLQNDKSQGSLKVTPDTTAWDVYNHHAGRVESERVKDWNNTLNTLLVFVGLYSAVLTAFIIESMKLIQEDSSDTSRDILLHLSRQLAVTSTPAFDPPSGPFVPPAWALRVNYFLFFSLSCALITALAAVLALQWVGSYDRGLNPSSVESCALQRQFRMEGAKRWGLEQIISSLPMIIFTSLLIFCVGLAEWLWHIHHNVAIIVMAWASFGALFYIVTTSISVLSISAPFRTPASRYLPQLFGLILKPILLCLELILNFISALFKRARRESNTVRTVTTFIGAMMPAPHSDVPGSTDGVPQWKLFLTRILKSIPLLYSTEPFEAREQMAVGENKDIKLSSLFWVARSISIEPYHRQKFRLIMKAILKQPKRELQHDRIKSNLWKRIFTELYVPYKEKKKWVDYSSDDLKNAASFVRGVSSIGQGFLDDMEFRDLVGTFYGTYAGLGEMCLAMKRWKLLDSESEQIGELSLKDTEERERENPGGQDKNNLNQARQDRSLDRPPHRIIEVQLEENNRVGARPLDRYPHHCREVVLANLDVALSFRDYFPVEFIIATLQRVKRDPKKLALITTEEMFGLIAKHLHIKSDDIARTHPLPFPILDLVQVTIITRLSGTFVDSLDPVLYSDIVTRYPTKLSSEHAEGALQSAILAHEAIMEQTISNLVHIDASKVSNDPRIQEILVKLDQLAQCRFGWGKQSVKLAFLSMLEAKIEIWSQNHRVYTAKSMLSLLKVEYSNFNGENWTVWWTEFFLAFEKFIDKDEDAESIVIEHGQRALLAHLPHHGQFSDNQITRLGTISHLGVRLFAVAVTQSTILANPILSIDSTQRYKRIWTPSTAWRRFIDICFGQLNAAASGSENFRRAFAVGSSLHLYDQIYDKDISRHIESPQDLFKYLSYPVLPVVLRHADDRESTSLKLLDIISNNDEFSIQFSKANGYSWLPTFVGKKPAYFEEVLCIIYQATVKCHCYSSASMWIKATLKCQEAAISVIGDGDNQITSAVLWNYISRNAKTLVEHIKVKGDTGVVPQSPSNDAQERLPAINPIRRATHIGKKLGLTILEDDAKPKLDTTAPKEWSAGDKKNWKTLVDRVITGFENIIARVGEAPTSYLEASMLPRNDVALLRRITSTGPDNSYVHIYLILDEIIASKTMSAEYFRAPVLNKIMRMDSERIFEITRTLRDISEHSWFTQEFIDANGPQLLPLRLIPAYLEETVELFTNALSLATTYRDTLLWLCLVYSCLNSVGIKLEGSESSRLSMLDDARWNLDQFASLIGNMRQKWHKDRGHQPIDMAPGGDDTNKGDVKSNARSWSQDEWEDIQEIVDELLDGGLKRGYIMPVPSASRQCFIRDPDGLTSFKFLKPLSVIHDIDTTS